MSGQKRKTPVDTPRASTPVSANSAFAARKRQAGLLDEDEATGRRHSLTPSNAFSALAGLRRSGNPDPTPETSPSPVKKAPPKLKSLRSANNVDGDQDRIQVSITQYTSFNLNDRNHKRITDGIELYLGEGERFLVQGMYGIKVLSGHISIASATLRPSTTSSVHWVHAPSIHAIPVIRTHADSKLQILVDEAHSKLRSLGFLSPLFSKIWNHNSQEISSLPGGTASYQMRFNSADPSHKFPIKELSSPPEWNKELSSLAKGATQGNARKYLVCGPKSAGKSTFSKMLVNRLVTRHLVKTPEADMAAVALLDIDPGQGEYGPPGTISLIKITQPNLGVPFTHPGVSDATYTVISQQPLAAVTPGANSELYLKCISELHGQYRQKLADLPLIINTAGWIQGTGLELLSEIISTYQPHEVLYMSQDGPAESVEALEAAALTRSRPGDVASRFTTLPSQTSEGITRTAAELREMQQMSYFHLGAPDNAASSVSVSTWDPSPLSHVKPWLIPYKEPTNLKGILCYGYQPPPDLLSDSINGSILAVMKLRTKLEGWPTPRRTPDNVPYIPNPDDITLDPGKTELLGLVLIRGIDEKQQCLLGLSPALQSQAQKLTEGEDHGIILLHGQFGNPNWAFTEDLYGGTAQGQQPHVEILSGNQSRPTGSRQWRVRRDLGRNN